jgi:hypothetical protein
MEQLSDASVVRKCGTAASRTMFADCRHFDATVVVVALIGNAAGIPREPTVGPVGR